MYWCHITLAIAAVPERNQKWRCAVDTHSSYLVSALRHVDTSRALPCVWFCSTGFYASWNIERQIICEMSDFKVINVIILSMNSSWFRSPTFFFVNDKDLQWKNGLQFFKFLKNSSYTYEFASLSKKWNRDRMQWITKHFWPRTVKSLWFDSKKF